MFRTFKTIKLVIKSKYSFVSNYNKEMLSKNIKNHCLKNPQKNHYKNKTQLDLIQVKKLFLINMKSWIKKVQNYKKKDLNRIYKTK